MNSTCFTLEEKKLLRAILNDGWIDLYRLLEPRSEEFSWWDYRAGAFQHNHGMRIDFLLGNASLSDRTLKAHIDKSARSKEKASDHAPIIVEI